MDKKQMESLYYYLVSLYHAYIIKLQNFLFEKLPTNTIIDFEDGFGLYIDSKKMLYHIRIIQLDKNIMKNFEFEDCEVVDQKNSILFKKVNCCNLKNIYDVKSNISVSATVDTSILTYKKTKPNLESNTKSI